MNDDTTLRTCGSRTDAYAVFKSMLDKGNPPDDWTTLLEAASVDMAHQEALQRMADLDQEAGIIDDHAPRDRCAGLAMAPQLELVGETICLTDTTPFTAGSLFTSDYLTHGITDTADHAAVATVALAARLTTIVDAFPAASQPNEAQTEDDRIWPVLAARGWTAALRRQHLAAAGREDVPDGLLFEDAPARARANASAHEWQRYGHGLAVVGSDR